MPTDRRFDAPEPDGYQTYEGTYEGNERRVDVVEVGGSPAADAGALVRRYAYRGQHFLSRLLPVRHRASGARVTRLLPVAVGLLMAGATGLIGIHLGQRNAASPAAAPTRAPAVPPPAPADPNTGPVFTSYEAEAAFRVGAVRVDALAGASGGRIVQNVGRDPAGRIGLLVFTKVAAPRTGRYALTVDYVSAEKRSAAILVNDADRPTVVEFAGNGSWTAVQHQTLTVDLVAGFNTIAFDNATDVTPRLDRITVYG